MNTDRFKFRVWEAQEGYLEGPLINGRTGKICGNGDYTIEPCTGWKDKHGTLIYEGDILLAGDFGVGIITLRWIVVWNPWCGCFSLKREDGLEDDFPIFATIFQQYSEVVGNIHHGATDCKVQ